MQQYVFLTTRKLHAITHLKTPFHGITTSFSTNMGGLLQMYSNWESFCKPRNNTSFAWPTPSYHKAWTGLPTINTFFCILTPLCKQLVHYRWFIIIFASITIISTCITFTQLFLLLSSYSYFFFIFYFLSDMHFLPTSLSLLFHSHHLVLLLFFMPNLAH